MSDTGITYCPGCASEVDVLGCDIEDRMICECPSCGVIEAVYYLYQDPDAEWLDQVAAAGNGVDQ